MIISSLHTFKTGDRDYGVIDVTNTWRNNPFVVLREATAEEWYAEAIAAGLEPERARRQFVLYPNSKFYEVSLD